MQHKPDPDNWKVVASHEHHVTVTTYCLCGDVECFWVVTAYEDSFVNHRRPERRNPLGRRAND